MTKEELVKNLERHPDVKDILIDVTERPIERKQDYGEQKKDFSGKKKTHTMKSLVVCSDTKLVLGLSKSEKGSKHDYKILKESEFM